jgi:glycosyltransferase involved in cell wall biosynthesis
MFARARALAERGIRVDVAAMRVQEPAAPGVNVHEAPVLRDREAPLQERLGEALSGDPDLIHVHQLDDPALIAALRRTAPVVVSAHGYTACTSGHHHFRPGEECGRAHGPGCIPNLIRCAHTRHPKTLPLRYLGAGRGRTALRQSDLAVSYSRAVDRHLAVNGVAPRAIVPYFPTVSAAPAPARRRGVFFAGRLVAAKGAGVLVRAMRDIDAELIIGGEGRDGPKLRRLAERLGIADRVRFTGWLPDREMAKELACAAVVAMPSVWPEPFGIVAIEALSAGTPVVVSATGGVLDWVQDGVNALAVPPGAVAPLAGALRRLLEDPGYGATLAAEGRAMVASRFSEERHVEVLLGAYAGAAEAWAGSRRAAA